MAALSTGYNSTVDVDVCVYRDSPRSSLHTSLFRLTVPPNLVAASSCEGDAGRANSRLALPLHKHFDHLSLPLTPPHPANIMATPTPPSTERVGLDGNKDDSNVSLKCLAH
jgi:hypothetical protein